MIDKNVLIPLFLAFAISVALSPFVIPFLQRLKVGQTEREEGVKSHLKKAGTPTMGGLIILISLTVTSLFFIGSYPKIVPVLFLIFPTRPDDRERIAGRKPPSSDRSALLYVPLFPSVPESALCNLFI